MNDRRAVQIIIAIMIQASRQHTQDQYSIDQLSTRHCITVNCIGQYKQRSWRLSSTTPASLWVGKLLKVLPGNQSHPIGCRLLLQGLTSSNSCVQSCFLELIGVSKIKLEIPVFIIIRVKKAHAYKTKLLERKFYLFWASHSWNSSRGRIQHHDGTIEWSWDPSVQVVQDILA